MSMTISLSETNSLPLGLNLPLNQVARPLPAGIVFGAVQLGIDLIIFQVLCLGNDRVQNEG